MGPFLRAFFRLAAGRAILRASTGCLPSLSFRPGVLTSPMGRSQEYCFLAPDSAPLLLLGGCCWGFWGLLRAFFRLSRPKKGPF